jgi:hypothetical protein
MASRRAHETDEESECFEVHEGEPTETLTKKMKTQVPNQSILSKYHEDFPCLVSSKKGKQFAHCTVCDTHFSVKHGGKYDCSRHMKSLSHKEYDANRNRKQKKLDGFVKKGADKEAEDKAKVTFERSVTKAEAMICHIIADANLPLSTADKLTEAVKVAFPDSKIAACEFLLINLIFIG